MVEWEKVCNDSSVNINILHSIPKLQARNRIIVEQPKIKWQPIGIPEPNTEPQPKCEGPGPGFKCQITQYPKGTKTLNTEVWVLFTHMTIRNENEKCII